jgi:hypothetical protein
MQEIDAGPCEMESSPGLSCSNTAYWRYNGIALCPKHMQAIMESKEEKCLGATSLSKMQSKA